MSYSFLTLAITNSFSFGKPSTWGSLLEKVLQVGFESNHYNEVSLSFLGLNLFAVIQYKINSIFLANDRLK